MDNEDLSLLELFERVVLLRVQRWIGERGVTEFVVQDIVRMIESSELVEEAMHIASPEDWSAEEEAKFELLL